MEYTNESFNSWRWKVLTTLLWDFGNCFLPLISPIIVDVSGKNCLATLGSSLFCIKVSLFSSLLVWWWHSSKVSLLCSIQRISWRKQLRKSTNIHPGQSCTFLTLLVGSIDLQPKWHLAQVRSEHFSKAANESHTSATYCWLPEDLQRGATRTLIKALSTWHRWQSIKASAYPRKNRIVI